MDFAISHPVQGPGNPVGPEPRLPHIQSHLAKSLAIA